MNSPTRATLLAVLSTSLLLLAQTDGTWAATGVKPGVRRCALLQSQMAAAARSKHMALPSRARSLAEMARQFCQQGKTAQGTRAYVKALTELGVTPDLEVEHVATGDIQ